MRSHLVFPINTPLKNYHIPLAALIVSHSSNFIICFSKICFFRPLSLNATNQPLISDSYNAFNTDILNFIRPSQNSIFNCHNLKALKFVTRLRLGLSHLGYHKFKHNFQDSLNAFCNCGLNTESTSHYLLHYLLFGGERKPS